MPAMSEPTSQDVEAALGAVHRYGAALLAKGKSAAEVRSALLERGLAPSIAEALVEAIVVAEQTTARRNIAWGAAIAGLGLVVAGAAYATQAGTFSYVVGASAAVFGLLRVGRGLARRAATRA